MDKFQDLNFNVVATDNATKVLKDVLDVLTKLEKKFNAFSKITMPNLNLTKEQVSLLKSWNKLDAQLKKVEQDLNKIGKVQKEIQKFEIVPKGKRPFNYDSGSKRYLDNNIALIKREQKAISDVFKGNQLLLPAPSSATLKAESLRQAHQIEDELSDYWSKQYLVNINKKTKFPYQALQYESGHGVAQLPEGFEMNENEAVEEYLKARKQINKELKKTIVETNNVVSKSAFVDSDYKELTRKEALEQDLAKLKSTSTKYNDALKKLELAQLRYKKVVEKVGLNPKNSQDQLRLKSAQESLRLSKKRVEMAQTQMKLDSGGITQEENKKDNKAIEKAKKNVNKFVKSIGRIVVYRIIRSAMAEIKKAVVSSSEELAKASEQYNKVMSRFTTSTDKIKYSLGLMIQPFIEALTPTLETVADVFAQIANYLSYINAKSKGLTEYTKINSEYAKDYLKSMKEANNLLSFDKFEVLQKTENKDIYETARVEDGIEASESIQNIATTIKDLSETVGTIATGMINVISKLDEIIEITGVTKMATSGINDVLKGIFNFELKPLLGGIVKVFISTLYPILKIVDFIATLLTNVINGFKNLIISIQNFFNKGTALEKPLEKIYDWRNGEMLHNLTDLYDKSYKSIDDWVNGRSSEIQNENNTKNENVADRAYGSTTSNIVVDFKNVNNNAIARELAKPIAEQLKKQNIKVTYS
jgi:hypothetical protein